MLKDKLEKTEAIMTEKAGASLIRVSLNGSLAVRCRKLP